MEMNRIQYHESVSKAETKPKKITRTKIKMSLSPDTLILDTITVRRTFRLFPFSFNFLLSSS